MHRFWVNYFSQEYGVTISEIFRDCMYQHSSLHTQELSGLRGLMISERSSFTRLHKSTLGLTCESLDKILHLCAGEIDDADSLGRTCLHLAAYQTNTSAIRILLAQGANPDITDQNGKAPLHVVAALGSFSAAKALVTGGADLEVRGQFGSTPLCHASIMGHYNVVQLLVDGGSNIEASNHHLETPVRHAILGDQINAVQLLHRRGAALTLEDKWGGYALQKSAWLNCHRVLKYLLGLRLRLDQRHQVRGIILHTLAELGDLHTIEIFLEIKHYSLANIDPTEANARGWPAMDHLESRPNAGELREPFLRVLKHVKLARQYNKEDSPASLDVDRSLVEEKGAGEQDQCEK
jgi:ankyrin repeat protein